ncbi:MAG: TIGR01777 family oxidoreductase [Bacteroidales bacterium]|nr:TIGR01777 family oxidoreductase [Bacteroidales bacterium]
MAKSGKGSVLITGGSGLVGRKLIPALAASGYEVRVLSRRKSDIPGAKTYKWNIKDQYIEDGALEHLDHIIHLAGSSIGKGRWTKSRKQSIMDSRVLSARLLFDSIEKRNPELKSFTSASATGYYGAVTTDKEFTEADPPGDDFAARVCIKWEEQAGLFRSGGYRTSVVRTGIVLSKKEGMLTRVMPTINMRFSPLFGKGRQYLPWIHIDDLTGIYMKILNDPSVDGIYNAVSPGPATYRDFIKTLSSVTDKKVFMPATPELPWKLLFGEKSQILLEGSRVSAEKVINAGYKFSYTQLKDALAELLI